MKLSIVVPCYNEEKGIPNLALQLSPVLKELKRKYAVELIFVDDGSTDNTFSLLKKYFGKSAKILRHEKNKNLGAALRTAFAEVTGDIIVTMDSDCTYPPKEIPNLIAMLDDETDIVTASPYHPKGRVANVPKYRLFLSKSISRIYGAILKQKIYTYTALFRGYKKDVIKNVRFKSDNFIAVAELLVFAVKKGYRVKEFPTTIYSRKFGTSKMKLADTIIRHLKLVKYLITHKQ
jgi:dolichol-phosphate mannosyltransferase